MQQEDEYRIQMELKRYLRKDSLSAGASSEQSFYETETARTPSSRGELSTRLSSILGNIIQNNFEHPVLKYTDLLRRGT